MSLHIQESAPTERNHCEIITILRALSFVDFFGQLNHQVKCLRNKMRRLF